ncbi:hypothetical protein OGAPHI_002356 [Ogataea philodendri]|uniref:Peroxisomal membrane protein PEX11 n=1 Tax=Ogataea philodendri TaxID=1378263 RepID=A0A9P8PB36_9ASCO|nr:uncharacterized protein OGAPHI_002356 [Ogataea philodendri]KAH3668602.1 hypothetical protein OGAPHI_002356 [Ogataea philodendri]
MVCDSITYHPTLTRLINFLETNNGRDKLLRTLQYLARLVSFYLLKTGSGVNSYYLARRIQDLFVLSRKPLRAFKPLRHLKTLSITLDNELEDSYTKTLETVKQAGYSLYYGFDSIYWLKLLGLLKNKNGKLVRKIEQVCSFFWLIALVSGLLQNLRQLRVSYHKKQALLKELTSSENKDPLDEKVNLEKQKETLETQNTLLSRAKREAFVRILDSIVALNSFGSARINDGVAGGAGIITSVLQLQDLWKNTNVKETTEI